MARSKITFQNKVENGGVTANGRVSANDINEIKDIVNSDIDQTYDKDQIDVKINAIGTGVQGAISISDPSPTVKGIYIPVEVGTYPNAGGLTRLSTDGDVQFIFNGSTWTKNNIPISTNAVLKSEIIDNLTGGLPTNVLSGNQGVVLNNKIIAIAGTEYELTKIGESSPISSVAWISESSTFSTWGSLVGVFNNFQAVSIRVKPFDAGYLITQVRIVIRAGAFNGAILGDKTVSVETALNVEKDVVVVFDDVITNPTNANLWVEYRTNGRTGIFRRQVAINAAATRYGTHGSLDTAPNVVTSNQWEQIYTQFYTASPFLKFSDEAEDAILDLVGQEQVEIILPSTLYALEGIEFNLYFDNIIKGGFNEKEMSVDVVCSVGKQMQRRYTYIPTAITSSQNIVINVYSKDYVLLATKTSIISIVPKSVGSSITRKVNIFGDSNTVGNGGNSFFPVINAELVGDPMTIQFVGTIGTGNAKNEGRSGWRIYDYSNNVAGNPLWNPTLNKVDYAYYLTESGMSMASNDWAMFFLGTNDMFNIATDANLSTLVPVAITQLNTLITAAKAGVSGIRVGIGMVIPSCFSQDSFGDDYATAQNVARFTRNIQTFQQALIDTYDDRIAENIYLVPLYSAIDRDYGFPSSLVNANSRNTEQVKTYTNAIHPNKSGYDQMGDTIFEILKAIG